MSPRGPAPAAALHVLAATGGRAQARAEAGDRLLLTVEEAADRLGIGRSFMYELLGRGLVGSIHVGRLRRVPLQALTDYVEALRRQAPTPDPAADAAWYDDESP